MLETLLGLLALLAAIALILLDLFGRLRLTCRPVMIPALLVLPHGVALAELCIRALPAWPLAARLLLCAGLVLLLLFLYIRVNLTPCPVPEDVGLRIRILCGGRRLLYLGLYAFAAQVLLCLWLYPCLSSRGAGLPLLVSDGVVAALAVFALLANGMLRVLCTSKRLNLVMRLVVLFTLWIPLWNLFLLFYCCRKAWEEYDHACYKAQSRAVRVEKDTCRTRYPLVLVHGVGFRDLKYLNYWGRIPRELIRNGASVYYGNQEAWGTIEANAADLKQTILAAMQQHGCDKVNLIAHSKGGLDSRYMISQLDMGAHVASLTTISTPHRGSRVVDWAVRMPNALYRRITRLVNAWFRRLGDRNPDFYNASRQFTTAFASRFNQQVQDVDGVYYQSYMSVMRGPFSDCLLALPYCIVRPIVGENDGLVGVDSAKWGDFRGVFRSSGRRGISHGDIIDLHRDDYKGFDVVETYVGIVAELKQKGF